MIIIVKRHVARGMPRKPCKDVCRSKFSLISNQLELKVKGDRKAHSVVSTTRVEGGTMLSSLMLMMTFKTQDSIDNSDLRLLLVLLLGCIHGMLLIYLATTYIILLEAIIFYIYILILYF